MRFKGYYTYNNEKKPTEFNLIKKTDTTIYGEGKDDGGNYTIEGKITKSGRIDFEKYYMGTNKVFLFGRAVMKSGDIDRLYGCWEIKDVCSGDFEYNLYK